MNFEGIYNYFERMVYDEVMRTLGTADGDHNPDDAEDIACLALNQLPSRYVRHSVDTAFFMEENERDDMEKRVMEAVKTAYLKVKDHPGHKE